MVSLNVVTSISADLVVCVFAAIVAARVAAVRPVATRGRLIIRIILEVRISAAKNLTGLGGAEAPPARRNAGKWYQENSAGFGVDDLGAQEFRIAKRRVHHFVHISDSRSDGGIMVLLPVDHPRNHQFLAPFPKHGYQS